MSFIRVVGMAGTEGMRVIHGGRPGPELQQFFTESGVSAEGSTQPARARYAISGLANAAHWLRKYPGSPFVVWAHHSDSNRWLQLALALAGRRFVIAERLVAVSRIAFARSRLTIPVKRIAASRATCVVLNSHSQMEHYRKLFGLSRAALRAIPGSRPIQSIRDRVRALRRERLALRKSLGLPADAKIVLCLARLEAQKAQGDLIAALGYLRAETGARIVLVGDGSDRTRLCDLAQRTAPGRIILAGHQSDPVPWLAAADVFALPSLVEGLPGALIEAMAAELPCVATDIPGNRDLVRNEVTGLSVPTENPQALADALRRILKDAGLANQLAAAGLALVERDHDEATERVAWCRLIEDLRAMTSD